MDTTNSIADALGGMNPQLPYYLMLFMLTIILRFIRAYRLRPKEEADAAAHRAYRVRYLYFGFELVNVSAGVFILLSEHATKYIAAVMMLYVILVILSFFFEDESVGPRLRTYGHLLVSFVVIAVTLYAFLTVEGLRPSAEASQAAVTAEAPIEATQEWRVALPYVDTTLNRNFGVKDNLLQSVYLVRVSAETRMDAVQRAKEAFFGPEGPTPFLVRSEKNPLTMLVLEGDAVAELQGLRPL